MNWTGARNSMHLRAKERQRQRRIWQALETVRKDMKRRGGTAVQSTGLSARRPVAPFHFDQLGDEI